MSDAPEFKAADPKPIAPEPEGFTLTSVHETEPPPEAMARAADEAQQEAERPGAMGHRAATGFALMLAQSMATRVLSFAGQIALAYLLLPEHFGLVGLAGTAALVAGIVQQIGVREVLLAEQKKFDELARVGFWMMTMVGLAASVLMAAAAPLMARKFGDPQLSGLVWVLAAATMAGSISTVFEADLQRKLRFKYLAGLAGLSGLVTTLSTVGLALAGFEAYSLMLPRLIVGVMRLVMLWRASGFRPGWSPCFGQWGTIAGRSSLVFACSALLLIPQATDYIVLGLVLTPVAVGFYTFAMNLSLQTVIMITQNLQSILLPTLGKFAGDPQRQLQSFQRAAGAIAAILAPTCLIQTFAAEPIMHAVFGHKWDGAIEPMRWLSVGMLFTGAYMPVHALMQVQGRYKTCVGLAAMNVVLFLAAVPLCGNLFGLLGVSVSVMGYWVVCTIIWAYVGVRPLGGKLIPTAMLTLAPGLAACAALAPGWYLSTLVPEELGTWDRADDWVRLMIIGMVGAALYLPLWRYLMPQTWADVMDKVAMIAERVRMPVRVVGLLRRAAAT